MARDWALKVEGMVYEAFSRKSCPIGGRFVDVVPLLVWWRAGQT